MTESSITVFQCDHGVEEWFGVGIPSPADYGEIFAYAHEGVLSDEELDELMASPDWDCGSLEITEIPVSDIKEEFLDDD